MNDDINKVSHVEEVDPGQVSSEQSSDVNDYLSMEGWILLNTGTHAATGDDGPRSWVYYVVGWVGGGEPQFPRPPLGRRDLGPVGG